MNDIVRIKCDRHNPAYWLAIFQYGAGEECLDPDGAPTWFRNAMPRPRRSRDRDAASTYQPAEAFDLDAWLSSLTRQRPEDTDMLTMLDSQDREAGMVRAHAEYRDGSAILHVRNTTTLHCSRCKDSATFRTERLMPALDRLRAAGVSEFSLGMLRRGVSN